MSKPSAKAIRPHLERQRVKGSDLDAWTNFLTGLDWSIIKPLVQMAVNSRARPAIAAGLVAHSTRDDHIRDTLKAHLEARAEQHRG